MAINEERLKEIEAGQWGEAETTVRELLAELRALRVSLEEAPTLEQMHALVGQLKEVRGENAKLRAELQSLQSSR